MKSSSKNVFRGLHGRKTTGRDRISANVPPNFNTHCKNTLNLKCGNNHTTVVTNYFGVLFSHAQKLWPTTLQAQRHTRQLLERTAGALLGIIARDLINTFSPTQKHSVATILQKKH